ncbi:MAG TPA: hypothetical protein DCQ06_04695 [Myxococcales bacterium]|nr:hypothetical protein [Myxococcales bacterium]
MSAAHRREQILMAVRSLAAEQGVYGVTIARVAKRADVPKSVVLYHFLSRDQLLKDALQWWLTPLKTRIDEVLEQRSMDPRDQLGAWLALHFEEHLDGWRMLGQLSLDAPNSPVAQVAAEFERWEEEGLSRLLSRGHKQLAWRAPRPRASAAVVRALVEGLILRCARAGEPAALVNAHRSARQAILDLLVRA